MRILSLAPGLDPARTGMAAGATSMVLAATRAGVECVMAVADHGGAAAASSARLVELQSAGVAVHAFPVTSWPPALSWRWGISPAQVTWTARYAKRFDLVHVHGTWGVGPLIGLIAGRGTRTPVVVSAHGSLTDFDIEASRSGARRRQKLILRSLYLRHTSLFILNSHLEASASLPTSARWRIVHLPIARDDEAARALRSRGESRELRVGFLGRIHPTKNLDLLIEALAELPPHVRLVIAGDNPAELVESLQRRAGHLKLSERLEWLGFVDPPARRRFLGGIDVLAMPSAFESFGLSAAEAMHDGVPVIVSERTGIAELIRRHGGGRIVEATATSIADAIRALDLERGSLVQLARQAQAAVRTELTYDQIGPALYEAYSDTIASRSA